MIPLIGWQQSVRFQVLVGCRLRCERTGQWDGGEKRRKKKTRRAFASLPHWLHSAFGPAKEE